MSRQSERDRETWWYNEEVQESIKRRRLAKEEAGIMRDEENRQEFKEMRGEESEGKGQGKGPRRV